MVLSARLTVEELTLYGGGLHKPPFATTVPNKFLHSYVHSFIREAIIKTPCTPTAASSPYSDTQVVRGLGIDLTPSSRERETTSFCFQYVRNFYQRSVVPPPPPLLQRHSPHSPQVQCKGIRSTTRGEVMRLMEKRKETKLITSLATPLLRQGSRQIRLAANVGSNTKPTTPKGLSGRSPDYLPPPSLPPSPRTTSLPLV